MASTWAPGAGLAGPARNSTSASEGLVFVDTNVLVYAYDTTAGEKRERARSRLDRLWSGAQGCLSVPVLQEFYVTVTRKVESPLERETAADLIRDLAYWRVHAPIAEDVLGAIGLQARHALSFWDAMILWSAQQLGCDVLWSEELTGQQ